MGRENSRGYRFGRSDDNESPASRKMAFKLKSESRCSHGKYKFERRSGRGVVFVCGVARSKRRVDYKSRDGEKDCEFGFHTIEPGGEVGKGLELVHRSIGRKKATSHPTTERPVV